MARAFALRAPHAEAQQRSSSACPLLGAARMKNGAAPCAAPVSVPCRVVPCCAVPCRAVLSGAGAAAAPSARPVAGAVPPRRAVLLLPAARAGLAREAE